MIEETATVVRVEDGKAWVTTQVRSACGHCGSAGGCTSGILAGLFGKRRNELQLDNECDARVGEQVVIGIPDQLLVRASLMAYMLPLFGMIGLALLGRLSGMSEDGAALASLCGLFIGLLFTRGLTGGSDARRQYRPRMLRRAQQAVAFTPLTFDKGAHP